MQIIVVLGVIAALIYYILKMRASAKQTDEESDESGAGGQGFMNDMFISSNSRAGSHSEKRTNYDGELDDERDERDERDEGSEGSEDKALQSDPYNDLEKLAALHEKGILTDDEYNAKKKELLDRI